MFARFSLFLVMLMVGCVSAKPIPVNLGRGGSMSEHAEDPEECGDDCAPECECDVEPLVCDELSSGACRCDPDCDSAPACESDGFCDPNCNSDPDCLPGCLCDRVIGLCNTVAPGFEEQCLCDLDCRFGAACASDGYCDRDCPSDEDCGDPVVSCREDGYCDFACIYDPDCDPTCTWAPDCSSGCACDLNQGLCDDADDRDECTCDEDCAGVTCGSDGVCEERCVSDSDCGGPGCEQADCQAGCICDQIEGVCEPAVDGTGDSCHCDADC